MNRVYVSAPGGGNVLEVRQMVVSKPLLGEFVSRHDAVHRTFESYYGVDSHFSLEDPGPDDVENLQLVELPFLFNDLSEVLKFRTKQVGRSYPSQKGGCCAVGEQRRHPQATALQWWSAPPLGGGAWAQALFLLFPSRLLSCASKAPGTP